MKPLDTSINNVKKANFLFPDLKTFVAPVLFEPNSLRSMPLENLVNKKPVGIEPTRYPMMHNTKKFIKLLNF